MRKKERLTEWLRGYELLFLHLRRCVHHVYVIRNNRLDVTTTISNSLTTILLIAG
jgi:hypothetical protein